MRKKILIACRASNLAVRQAEIVIKRLKKFYPNFQFSLKKVITSADRFSNVSLRNFPQEGVFVKELEKGLLNGTIDIAVHSAKDMPMNTPKDLVVHSVLKRENPSDCLISRNHLKLKDLPYSAKIGTGSLRRIIQLKNIRRDLNFVEIRGNLETRIKKMHLLGLDGIVLAYAGLKRLGLSKHIAEILDILPSPGQGAIFLETKDDNPFIEKIVRKLNHKNTFLEINIEKELLQKLGGGCNLPLGAIAKIKGSRVSLKAAIGFRDAEVYFSDEISCSIKYAGKLGGKMAGLFIKRGAGKLLQYLK